MLMKTITFYFCIIHRHSMYSCLYLHYITINWINSELKLRIISTWYDIEARVWVVFGTHLLAKNCQCKQYMIYHTQTTRSNNQVKIMNYQVIWPGRTWRGVATDKIIHGNGLGERAWACPGMSAVDILNMLDITAAVRPLATSGVAS